MKWVARPYQTQTVGHLMAVPRAAAFLEMGLGKTVSTLTAIDLWTYDTYEVVKTLVIAPKAVALTTWIDELAKWDHLGHLRMSLMVGDANARRRALRAKADIYVIGVDNIAWLIAELGGVWPYQALVIDESSKFKNQASGRSKILKPWAARCDRVVLLSGTPAPKGLIDIWNQIYFLDQGERLGKNITGFRNRYFSMIRTDTNTSYIPHDTSSDVIHRKISDLVISMKAKDYLDIPDRVDNYIEVKASSELIAKYKAFEKTCVMEIMDAEITAFNAGALTTKLQQFANGAVYDAEGNTHAVHDLKLEALGEIIDTAQGNNVLIFYAFQHDLDRIVQKYGAVLLNSDNIRTVLPLWNAGKIPLLIAHPKSAGHGLNMQDGGHILVWYGLTWDLELWLQAIARLERGEITKAVIMHVLYCAWSIEKRMKSSLGSKKNYQDALLEATKALRLEYSTGPNIA